MKSYLQELAIQQEFNISKDGPIIERPKIKEMLLKNHCSISIQTLNMICQLKIK